MLNLIKHSAKFLLVFFPLRVRITLKFFARNKYIPLLNAPRTFNEKISYRKLFNFDGDFVRCADKYLVRDYVSEKIGSQYLIPLLYVDVDISENVVRDLLVKHEMIVVKVNNNSGGIFFLKQNETINFEAMRKSLLRQLNESYGLLHDEPWYDKIPPKIVVEKMLLTTAGSIPEDYKFHIFNYSEGRESKLILQIDYDRFSGHNRTFYDQHGAILPYVNKYPNKFKPFPKFDGFELMKDLALKLAEGFDYVRVDLYNINGQVYFGELTFSHGSGLDNFATKEQDLEWGSFWEMK